MALVSVSSAHLAFGLHALLDGADFSIEGGERVALIGRNGCGKSTLLRILAGEEDLDDGLVVRDSGIRVARVAQEPEFEPGNTVFEAVAAGLAVAVAQIERYEQLSAALASAHDTRPLLEQLHELQVELEASGAWSVRSRIERVIDRLGLEPRALLSTLSGGTRKRVALARALVSEPDLLLLDEPTNHLDLSSIAWLEDLLLGYAGAIIVITHDRRFLDRIATRVVELDRGGLLSYPGNYASYQRFKNEQLATERTVAEKFDKVLAQEEVWIRQGVEARRTRNQGRVLRLEALRRERAARRERSGQVRLDISAGERSGKLVAELIGVSKSFGANTVVRDFSTTIVRGDKIGVIGNNGVGKTTLLRLILGELAPDAGTVRLGSGLQIAYFDQMRRALDDDATLADTISPGSEWIEIGERRTHVISYLGDFLFPPERARAPVRSLSGGERNRLLLARLFARPANVLVLDEPTNDLDIDTLELLEALLQEYAGTLFLVTHDRDFLDNVVTQTIVAEGNGRWVEYAGGYDDWMLQSGRTARSQDEPAPVRESNPPRRPVERAAAVRHNGRLSWREQRELEGLPARIAALEGEQKLLHERLADPTLYRGEASGEEVRSAKTRAESIETELLECLERWEELEARST